MIVLLAVVACGNGDEGDACGVSPPPAGKPGVTAWSDRTAAVGLPLVRSQSASARDVDGDGQPDFLVARDPYSVVVDPATGETSPLPAPELYLGGCGSMRPLGLASAVSGDPLLDHVSATSITDLDGDGRVDLLLGGLSALQVLYQEPGEPLRFTAVTTSLTERTYGTGLFPDAVGEVSVVAVFDLDRDGVKDVYAAQVARDERLTGLDGEADRPTVQDAILLGDGQRDWRTPAEPDPRLVACGAGQTFGVAYITRWHARLPPLLYTGRDFGYDCLFEIGDGGELGRKLEIPEYGAGAKGESWFSTMGVDHTVLDDSGEVLIAVSDWGSVPLIRVRSSGEVEDQTHLVGYGPRVRVGWGLRFLDADLDGVTDLVVAYGNGMRAPTGQVEQAEGGPSAERFLLNSLRYYRGGVTAEGTLQLSDASASAGPWFTPGASGTDDLDAILSQVTGPGDVEAMRRDWHSLADLDVDRDGCADLLTAPMLQFDLDFDGGTIANYGYTSRSNVTLLRNDCTHAHHWLGLDLPDEAGISVALTFEQAGRTVERYAQVPAAPGIGAVGERNLLRFGFGAEPPTLKQLVVFWNDGTATGFWPEALRLGGYTTIRR